MHIYSQYCEISLPKKLRALGVLAFSLCMTLLATVYTHNEIEDLASQSFRATCLDLTSRISARLETQANLLRCGAAYISASDTITRQQWKQYCHQTRADVLIPGVQGVGYAATVPARWVNQHVNNIRREGLPSYTIWPEPSGEVVTSIIFIEPFAGINLNTVGYDMYSEPVRRHAMALARDSASATISGKAMLDCETPGYIHAGVLMYFPVYQTTKPTATVEQRRVALKGWVYSPCRTNDLMEGILGRWDTENRSRILMHVYDDSVSQNTLLYNSQMRENTKHKPMSGSSVEMLLNFNGKRWVLLFSQSTYNSSFFTSKTAIVLTNGIVISLMLFVLSLALFHSHRKVDEVEKSLSSELYKGELRFKSMFTHHNSVMMLIDPRSGNIIDANNEAIHFYGYSREQMLSMNIDQINMHSNDVIAQDRLDAVNKKQNYFNFYHKIASGVQKQVEVYSSPIEVGGEKLLFSIIHDISDRRKAEDKLLFWQDVFKNAKWGISISSSSGGVFELVNHEFARMHGYSEDELVGKPVSTVFANEHYDKARAVDMLIDNDIHKSWEAVHKRKDGSTFPVLVDMSIVKDRAGTVIQEVVNTQDITRRKLVEKALRESEERWKFAVEGASDGLWDWDLLTNDVYYSRQWKEILGYREHEIRNTFDEWQKRVHPDDLQTCQDEIAKYIRGETPLYSTTHRLQCKGGAFKWILARGKIMSYTNDGEPNRIIGTHTDITDRVEMEQALRESEAKANAILHTIPDMMFIQNTVGVYLDYYVPCSATTFVPPKVFVGQTIENTLPADIVEKFLPLFRKAISIREAQFLEYSLEMPDKLHHFEARTINYETDKVLTIVRDITDRHEAEKKLEQTRKNYEVFFNTIEDFLFVLDEEGCIIFANETVYSRLDYSPQDLVGQSVLMVHPHDRRSEAGRIVMEMLSGVAEYCPVPIMTRSGALIDVETRVKRGMWDDRHVIFGVTKDISLIKRSEEKFSKAFNSNSSLMAITLFDSGIFIEVNDSFLRVLGYNRDEVVGYSARELKLFEDINARECFITRLAATNEVRDIEIEVRTKKGGFKRQMQHLQVLNYQLKIHEVKKNHIFFSDVN